MLKQTLFLTTLTISLSSFCGGDDKLEWVDSPITPADTPSYTEAPSIDDRFDSYMDTHTDHGDTITSAAESFSSGPVTFEK
jgi:hypothetical protein